jgi:hypothetical protein
MVPGVPSVEPADERDEAISRLTEELTRVRAELAAARREDEGAQARLAKLRARRNRAERTAEVLSQALAARLRLDIARKTADRRLLSRLQQDLPTPDEAEQLELLRTTPLFDAAWYLRSYQDVVRSGDEPGLHFLRNAVSPFRSPSPVFDTAQYVEDHPEVLDLGVNPLVHFLMTPEGRTAERYPPEG